MSKWKLTNVHKHLLLISVLIISLLYLLISSFYRTHYVPRSRIGAVSIGNQTIESAQKRLEDYTHSRMIVFYEDGQEIAAMSLGELNLTLKTEDSLVQFMDQQYPTAWLLYLLSPKKHSLNEEAIVFDDGMLELLIQELVPDNEDRPASLNAKIIEEAGGKYSIQEETYGKQLSVESLKQALSQHLFSKETNFQLENAYEKPLFTADSDLLSQQLAEIDRVVQTPIQLIIGSQEVEVSQEVKAEWIAIGDSGNVEVDREAVENYLYGLNEEYAASFQAHPFESTYHGTVWIQPGTYGWSIDRFAEAEKIEAALLDKKPLHEEVEIIGSGYGTEDYFGGNYVEVDITSQMMFIYHDYELVFQTPVVTGITGASTVPGAYEIWNMESPSVLNGYDHINDNPYAQPVQYWVAFDDQAQGIHDASWQGSFGGSVYLTAGSLGCVNVSPSVMGQAYELMDYGMPVIVFDSF